MTTIQSVTGPVDSSELGICLAHEHIINDVRSWWHPPFTDFHAEAALVDAKVSINNLWALRHDPFINRDNCALDDIETAVAEVQRFADLGGGTILEATGGSIGRNPTGLRAVSDRTGVTVIMGTGFYLDSSLPSGFNEWSVRDIADMMLRELVEGVDGSRPGFIGEIGVSAEFTDREHTSLAAASVVQCETGLPMQVHMPGWFRLGPQVLDFVEQHGADPQSVVLCHSNPSGDDLSYQEELLRRGAWIQYDMIGMDVFYADQQVQCPSDEENARNIVRLVNRGWGEQILLSSDIFLKTLLRANGGPGYGHIIEYFIPRLIRHGLAYEQAMGLLTDNVPRLFEASARK